VPHPNLSGVITDDVRSAIHLKLTRDEDGRPVDTIHIHGYAPPELTRPIEEAIWAGLDPGHPVPDGLGEVEPGVRSAPLALTQLILLYHLLQLRPSPCPNGLAEVGA
jgi:phosphoribulokinase